MNPERKDFLQGQIISSKEEWEAHKEDWINRSPIERLNAIEILRQQYLELFCKSKEIDLTVFGLR